MNQPTTSSPQQQGPIGDSTSTLLSEIESLGQHVDQLNKNLSPILSPLPEGLKDGAQPETPNVWSLFMAISADDMKSVQVNLSIDMTKTRTPVSWELVT